MIQRRSSMLGGRFSQIRDRGIVFGPYHASGKICKPFDEIPKCLHKIVPTPAESLDHL